MLNEKIGVIHGRFQILHNDHLRYLLAGKALCEHLVVGITNPDPVLTGADPADPDRSAPQNNPLTYYERQAMATAALRGAGLLHDEFSVVPLPVNLPEIYGHYVPLDALFFLTIYDDWGRRKKELFTSLGLRIHVLWERPIEEKGICGREVRRRMAAGEPWDHLVPESVAAWCEAAGVPARLRTADSTRKCFSGGGD